MTVDIQTYVESVRRHTAELRRRNSEATNRARAELPGMVEVIRATKGVRRAYLFGSLAKDRFHPGGDIDIAVDGLNWDERDELRQRLKSISSFPVDVVNLDASDPFRGLVEFYGELLHADAGEPTDTSSRS